MFINHEITKAAQDHAREEYPYESCGLVAGETYVPVENTAKDRTRDFAIAPGEYILAERSGPIRAVIHSHPDGPDHPSRVDMAGQIASGLAWGIVPVHKGATQPVFFWGGDTPVPDLQGRMFRHGVTDCYALVRDWYRLKRSVTLPDYPRSDKWWETGDDLILDNFRDAGFEVCRQAPVPGDVALMQVCSNTVSHCGVYIGNGLMLHHLANRVSRQEPMGRWRKHILDMVRRATA